MKLPSQLVSVPASYFSATLGLTGLGGAWRLAHHVWGYAALVGELIFAFAGLVWAYLLIAYVIRWAWSREIALQEAKDPVQCCFIGLAGVATMLVSAALLPYSRATALVLMLSGFIFTIAFGIWRAGQLWSSERSDNATTAVLYIPTVAGGFVSAILLAAFGWKEWGQMTFGAALFSWLAIESVLLRRLYIGPPLPVALRPTMGVQLAPPAVGLVALLSVSTDAPGIAAHALLGYALLQCAVLLGRFRWIARQAFSPAYWGFSFAVTALGQAPLIMISRGNSQPALALAPVLFGTANLVVGILLVGSIKLVFSSKLSPDPKLTSA